MTLQCWYRQTGIQPLPQIYRQPAAEKRTKYQNYSHINHLSGSQIADKSDGEDFLKICTMVINKLYPV